MGVVMKSAQRTGRMIALSVALIAVAMGARAVSLPTRAEFAALQLPRVDGSRFVRTADYRGRVLVINYWRSDCAACASEMQQFTALARDRSEIAVLGVAIEDRTSAMRFLMRHAPGFEHVYAPLAQGELLQRAGNSSGGLPYTVVLDPEQRICASRVGAVPPGWLEFVASACATAR